MKVSVQVLTYNHEFCIQRCLKSILGQNFTDFEIVVGVDLSTDLTLNIVERFQSESNVPIHIVKQTKRQGAFKNFTDIIKRCSGDFIAICDGDDYWTDSEKLSIQYNFMKTNPDIVISYHSANLMDLTGQILRTLPLERHKNSITSVPYLIQNESIMPSSSIMYKNQNIGDFSKIFNGLRDRVDFPLVIYLMTHGKAGFIDRNMSAYTQASNPNAWSSQNTSYRNIEDNIMFKLIDVYTNHAYYDKLKCKILRNYLNIFLYEITKHEIIIAKSTLLLIRKTYRDDIKRTKLLHLYILLYIRRFLGRFSTEVYFKILIRLNIIKYE